MDEHVQPNIPTQIYQDKVAELERRVSKILDELTDAEQELNKLRRENDILKQKLFNAAMKVF